MKMCEQILRKKKDSATIQFKFFELQKTSSAKSEKWRHARTSVEIA